MVIYFHAVGVRLAVFVCSLVVPQLQPCRRWAGKLEAGSGRSTSLITPVRVLFLGPGRRVMMVADVICSCKGRKALFLFCISKKARDQEAHAHSDMVVCTVILSLGRLRQAVLHESEASLAT